MGTFVQKTIPVNPGHVCWDENDQGYDLVCVNGWRNGYKCQYLIFDTFERVYRYAIVDDFGGLWVNMNVWRD